MGWGLVMRGLSFALSFALCLFIGLTDAYAQWREVEPAGFRAKVLLPGPPAISFEDVKTEVGTVKVSQATWEGNGVAYVLSYNEYPTGLSERQGVERGFANVRKGIEERGQKLLKHHRLTVVGLPAQQALIQAADGRWFLSRQIVWKDRMYQLTVAAPSNPERDPDALKFLNSFAITMPEKCVVGC
jgi:hypothetical protein